MALLANNQCESQVFVCACVLLWPLKYSAHLSRPYCTRFMLLLFANLTGTWSTDVSLELYFTQCIALILVFTMEIIIGCDKNPLIYHHCIWEKSWLLLTLTVEECLNTRVGETYFGTCHLVSFGGLSPKTLGASGNISHMRIGTCRCVCAKMKAEGSAERAHQ